jgi:hypothetical protein
MKTSDLYTAARTYSAYGARVSRRQPIGMLLWKTHPPRSDLVFPVWSSYLHS